METSKNKSTSHRVKIPQSKLNYDNKITSATLVTAKEIEEQINNKLDELGKSRQGDSDHLNIVSELNSMSERPSSQNSDSEDEGNAKNGEDSKALKLRAFQTDIHIKEKLERAIDEKNPYRYSANAGYGDIPKVFAFEVENNIRGALQSILRPIVAQHEKAVLTIADLQTSFTDVVHQLEKVNRKLDQEAKMHDSVTEAANNQKKLIDQIEAEKDFVHKKLMELKQMQGVHDDRMSKYKDEKILFERKQEQLRLDVREFERLSQDLAKRSQNWVMDLRSEMNQKFDEMQCEMDAVTYDNLKVANFVNSTKSNLAKVNTSIGVINYNIEQIDLKMQDFCRLEENFAETEKYLGYVLPIKIQERIYENLVPFTKSKEMKLGLMETTQDLMKEMYADLALANEDLTKQRKTFIQDVSLNKVPFYTFPKVIEKPLDLKDDIIDLKQMIKDDEESSIEEEQSDEMQSSKQPTNSRYTTSRQTTSRNNTSMLSKKLTKKEESQSSNSEEQDSESSDSEDVETPVAKKSITKKLTKANTKKSEAQVQKMRTQGPVQFNKLKIKRSDVEQFSKKIGRELLRNEGYLDKLADALDGMEISETEDDYESESSEEDSQTYSSFNKAKGPTTGRVSEVSIIQEEEAIQSRTSRTSSQNDGDVIIQQQPLQPSEERITEPQQKKMEKNSSKEKVKEKTKEKEIKVKEKTTKEKERPKEKEKKKSVVLPKKKSKVEEKKRKHSSNLDEVEVVDPIEDEQEEQPAPRESRRAKRAPKTVTVKAKSVKIKHEPTEQSEEEEEEEQQEEEPKPKKEKVRRAKKSIERSPPAEAKVKDSPSKSRKSKKQKEYEPQVDESFSSRHNSEVRQSQKRKKSKTVVEKSKKKKHPSPPVSDNEIEDQVGYLEGVRSQSPVRRSKRSATRSHDEGPVLRVSVSSNLEQEIYELKLAVKKLQSQSRMGYAAPVEIPGFVDSEDSPDEAEKDDPSPTKVSQVSENEPLTAGVAAGSGVPMAQFQKLQKTVTDMRQNVRILKMKVVELESMPQQRSIDLRNSGRKSGRKSERESPQIMMGASQVDLRRQVEERLKEVELLKNEMKKELKRLQRQDLSMHTQFDRAFSKIAELKSVVDGFDNRLTLSDNTMAIIFKLLRIQYALSHQDELDKQDIFLMGAREQANPGFSTGLNVGHGHQDSIDLTQNSIHSAMGGKNRMGQTQQHFGMEVPQITSRQGHSLMTFDKNCMQCGGHGQASTQIPYLIKAFKMACLSYKPSTVIFEQKSFERNQLIEAQGYLLYLSLKQMAHLDFEAAEKGLLGSQADNMNRSNRNSQLDELALIAAKIENHRTSRDNDDFNTGGSLQQSVDSIHEQPSFAGAAGLFSSGKMISLAKSKEYTKLASQVPQIFTVKDGKTQLNVGLTNRSKKREMVVSKHKNVFNFNTINVLQGSAASVEQSNQSFDGRDLNMSSARQTGHAENHRKKHVGSPATLSNAYETFSGDENPLLLSQTLGDKNSLNPIISPRAAVGTAVGQVRDLNKLGRHQQAGAPRQSLKLFGASLAQTARGTQNQEPDVNKSQIFSQQFSQRQPTAPTSYNSRTNSTGQQPIFLSRKLQPKNRDDGHNLPSLNN